MAEVYTMEFKNASDKPWYISVHQAFPNHCRLESLAWQVATLPPQLVHGLPSKKKIRWELQYGVCLASYNEEERKFTPIQITPAILGRQYEVVCDTNGDPMISKTPAVEPVKSDLIVLKNNTNPVQTLNLGFVIDNNIVAVEQNVGGQLKVTYPAKRSLYHITCHRHILPGQQVDNCAALNPIKLEFTEGSHIHSIVIQKDPKGNYHLQSLTEIETLPQKSVGIEEIDVGQETYSYGSFADKQTNSYNKFWPNELCSREDLLAFNLILVCCLIFVTALLLTVILFLCLYFMLILILMFLLIA